LQCAGGYDPDLCKPSTRPLTLASRDKDRLSPSLSVANENATIVQAPLGINLLNLDPLRF